MKLWGGRFDKDVDQAVNDFNASLHIDGRMYREDIEGSIAHAAMLGKQHIIDPSEAARIVSALTEILADIDSGKLDLSPDNEDIHMNIEAILTQRLGDAGKRLHTARSRNDQVALDIRLYLKKETIAIKKCLLTLLSVLCNRADGSLSAVMPGYTHLQRAQPTTFAHVLMAYAQMFKRDVTRLADCAFRMDEMPLGSGALAGTTYPIDRQAVCGALGFRKVTDNSLDGVSDRDFCIELAAALSIIMMHLSRFSEELILWCSWEFKFIELDDAYATGSSIMPQKKNPDIAELCRGKTGRVYGDLVTLLTLMKALPLAYNKDMQEDKEAVFDAVDTVKSCLSVFTPMLKTLTILPDNMRHAAGRGFINATDCADYLTKKGVPFREAYTVVGRLVNECIKTEKTLETLPMGAYQAVSPAFGDDVYAAISLDTCLSRRTVTGGPAASEVTRQISVIRAFIEENDNE